MVILVKTNETRIASCRAVMPIVRGTFDRFIDLPSKTDFFDQSIEIDYGFSSALTFVVLALVKAELDELGFHSNARDTEPSGRFCLVAARLLNGP